MKPHLVIVDDDPLFRADISLILENDFRCTAVESIPNALDVIESDRPDLLLLDVHLGKESSGFDLLNELKQRQLDLPVVMTSDRPSITTVIRAIKWKVRDFLPKTAGLGEISSALKNAIQPHN